MQWTHDQFWAWISATQTKVWQQAEFLKMLDEYPQEDRIIGLPLGVKFDNLVEKAFLFRLSA